MHLTTSDLQAIKEAQHRARVDSVGIMKLVGYPERAKSLLVSATLEMPPLRLDDPDCLTIAEGKQHVELQFNRGRGITAIRKFVGQHLKNFQLVDFYNTAPKYEPVNWG